MSTMNKRMLACLGAVGELPLKEEIVREIGRGDVPLDAVEDVVVAVPAGGRLEVGHIGAGVLFGDGVALVLLAGDGRQDVSLHLIWRRDLRRASREECLSASRGRW